MNCVCYVSSSEEEFYITFFLEKAYNGEKTISSTNGAGKTGQPLVKEWN